VHTNHKSGRNFFARLTSLAAEDGSRRIENFCTESLACILLNSEEFQREFLRLADYIGPVGSFEFHTQRSCCFRIQKVSDSDKARKNYFDLLVVEPYRRLLFVIELKASSGFGADQLPKYRRAAEQSYPGFRIKLLSVSPHNETPIGSDIHVRWCDVVNALRRVVLPSGLRTIVHQFADFLEDKELSTMKLHPISPSLCKQWNAFAEHQHQFIRLLKLLFNDGGWHRKRACHINISRPVERHRRRVGWIRIFLEASKPDHSVLGIDLHETYRFPVT
jgi:hypothetical protein